MKIQFKALMIMFIFLGLYLAEASAECEPFYDFELATSKKLGRYIKDTRNNQVLSSGYWSMSMDPNYANRVYAKSSYRINQKSHRIGGRNNEAFSLRIEYDEVTVSWYLEVCLDDSGYAKVYYIDKSETTEHKEDYQ